MRIRFTQRHRHILAWALLGLLGAANRATGAGPVVSLELHGRKIEGMPLGSSSQQVALLGRDGALWHFKPGEPKNFRTLPGDFRSYSPSEMRGLLMREFGPQYEVSGTGSYLVVHPKGQRDTWAARFEELYRSFRHYFSVRGQNPTAAQFPLVAIVCPRRADFDRMCEAEGMRKPPNLLGFYSPKTNRVLMYDATSGDEPGQQDNVETIFHETAHQVAFNTGIHDRFSGTPRWAAEGIGTLFEARGLYAPSLYRDQKDRINRKCLAGMQTRLENWKSGTLAHVISSDRIFDSDGTTAYCIAWSFTFFLAETDSRRWCEYLQKVKGSEIGAPPAKRLKDFTSVFGDNLTMMESRYLRFIRDLK